MELTITKERVLLASKKCSRAKEVLKELFPEVFEDDTYFDLSALPTTPLDRSATQTAGLPKDFFEVRTWGDYAYKGFYLSSQINWQIVKDGEGASVLLLTKK